MAGRRSLGQGVCQVQARGKSRNREYHRDSDIKHRGAHGMPASQINYVQGEGRKRGKAAKDTDAEEGKYTAGGL